MISVWQITADSTLVWSHFGWLGFTRASAARTIQSTDRPFSLSRVKISGLMDHGRYHEFCLPLALQTWLSQAYIKTGCSLSVLPRNSASRDRHLIKSATCTQGLFCQISTWLWNVVPGVLCLCTDGNKKIKASWGGGALFKMHHIWFPQPPSEVGLKNFLHSNPGSQYLSQEL